MTLSGDEISATKTVDEQNQATLVKVDGCRKSSRTEIKCADHDLSTPSRVEPT